ncbi:homoserine dehydrogenase [Kordiimonas aquimaris]|uniref:homoserine dehydrogenase n=1 Tax=Kordiimonas aquimaris TaxID=707591 RepID=UPI0021D32E80|nr:homoserine dehydrogenase [Kordiimonas aquimaris]
MNNNEIKPLGLGVAGLGTVGVGVLKIIEEHAALLSVRAGRPLRVVAVSAREKARDRGVDITQYAWCDNAVDLASLESVDLVVELMGGSDGPAYALAKATLSSGKAFVTANKALIATHGKELASLAEAHGSALRFEAAVAGGIPIIKALTEGLSSNNISGLHGILNGTCNYILTRMEHEHMAFADVLSEAQKIGYAEADPTFDIDGIDTAHKTAILAALAFGIALDIENLPVEGIRNIEAVDIDYARELGYRIKLLGVAQRRSNGIDVRVHPAMVPLLSSLAGVMDATNAVVVHGDSVGQTVFEGPGAGQGPTASAVVADVIDVARGINYPPLGIPVSDLATLSHLSAKDHVGTYYMRLKVADVPGVMADITQVLAREKVSIESMLQRGMVENGGVYIVLTTHETTEDAANAVLNRFNTLECVLESPAMLRIEAA